MQYEKNHNRQGYEKKTVKIIIKRSLFILFGIHKLPNLRRFEKSSFGYVLFNVGFSIYNM